MFRCRDSIERNRWSRREWGDYIQCPVVEKANLYRCGCELQAAYGQVNILCPQRYGLHPVNGR